MLKYVELDLYLSVDLELPYKKLLIGSKNILSLHEHIFIPIFLDDVEIRHFHSNERSYAH